MKQLSDTEKQELEPKIKDEEEYQEALREMNPNTPEESKIATVVTRFTSSYLWKYGVARIHSLLLSCLERTYLSSSSFAILVMTNTVSL